MCPGGTVVAATSEPGRVVTNGMSQYSRNERNANSGHRGRHHAGRLIPAAPLAGIAFQRHWEEPRLRRRRQRLQRAGAARRRLPRRPALDANSGAVVPSYTPGVHLTDLAPACRITSIAAMREALPAFGRQIPGFAMDDAVLTGVETRTSSPIRITRDETFQSLNTRGLYPAGEGAGYAGGILSAAIDGIKVAEAVALSMTAGTAPRG